MAKRRKRKTSKAKIVIFIIEIIVFLILLAAMYLWAKLNLIQRTTIDDKQVGISEEINTELMSGYTNIALFGLDNRSNGNLESGLSDVIMVMSVNNDTKEVRLVSVYRDTYLKQESGGEEIYRKANAAYSIGGPTEAIKMLNENLDLDITDYATVDFYALVEAIDLVGGIDLTIEADEVDYVNGYAQSVSEVTGKSFTPIPSAGTYTVDGVVATGYCRIRYTAGGDFTRAQRQRTVLSQLFKKAKTMNVAQLNTMVNEIFPDIQTSLTNGELLSMATSISSYELAATSGFPFTLTTATFDSVGSVDVACTLLSNVKELHKYLFDEEDYAPSSTVQTISSTIVTNTGLDEDDAVDYGIVDEGLTTIDPGTTQEE